MKLFKTSFWIAIVLSLGYMLWKAISHKGLVCGYLEIISCGIKSWLMQLGIMFVVLLVVLIIILGILTRKRTRSNIAKEKKIAKFDALEAVERKQRKRIKI